MDPVPAAQAEARPHRSPLFALAREIDARLRQRSTTRRRTFAEDAFDLLECKRLELFRLLGYSSVTAYARTVNGFGSSKTSALIKIAEACQRLPRIRTAFLAGELDWCVAEQLVKRATPVDEEQWLEKAKLLSVAELKAIVREEAPLYWRKLGFTAEELAWVETAADAIRKEQGPFALAKALAEVCRRALQDRSGAALGGPRFRIVINDCQECGKATRETSEGPVQLSPAESELARCDAEVLDIRSGPAHITRTPPPRIRNYVLERDRHRCVVPGCRNRSVEFHHEDGWQSGHDPTRCFGLCAAHHRDRHRGLLRTEGSMPNLRFFLADGTCLGTAGGPRSASPLAGPSAHADTSPAPPQEATALRPHNPVEDATEALVELRYGPREATAAVRAVIQREPMRSWGAGELVRAVLRGRASAA